MGRYLRKTNKKYKRVRINGKLLREHRVIMERFLGRQLLPTEFIHHINGDSKDNRIENLQIVSRSEHAKIHYKQNDFTLIGGRTNTSFKKGENHLTRVVSKKHLP